MLYPIADSLGSMAIVKSSYVANMLWKPAYNSWQKLTQFLLHCSKYTNHRYDTKQCLLISWTFAKHIISKSKVKNINSFNVLFQLKWREKNMDLLNVEDIFFWIINKNPLQQDDSSRVASDELIKACHLNPARSLMRWPQCISGAVWSSAFRSLYFSSAA